MKRALFTLVGLLIFVLAAACGGTKATPEVVYEVFQVFVTATSSPTFTPTITPTPTQTPTPTPTYTPTPTPTATAQPAAVVGDPVAAHYETPVPQFGAPCGFADTFDFPLDPPDGIATRGGSDFGVFRSRYGRYHAGEDWGYQSGSNFGKPVYAIGHGQVTYAAPNGWGTDKGVIIIKHILKTGGYLLSFYGHLDPPSVTLRTGACVLRGAEIAVIGRPRTPPHLHFEIRLHMPDLPGPGYWARDPVNAGWRPPSQTIWNYRAATSPGVLWAGLRDTGSLDSALTAKWVGALEGENFVVQVGDELLGVNKANGRARWRLSLPQASRFAVLDDQAAVGYASTPFGDLAAYALAVQPPHFLWDESLALRGTQGLLPLPGGGVVVTSREMLAAVSPDGELLWSVPAPGVATSWVGTAGQLFILTPTETTSSVEALVWMVDQSGANSWEIPVDGDLLAAETGLFLHGKTGFYALDPAAQTVTAVYRLPDRLNQGSGAVVLPNGGVLLAHADPGDRRLLRFSEAGTLLWEKSFAALPAGRVQLAAVGSTAALLLERQAGSMLRVSIYAVDLQSGDLVHVFEGGGRDSYSLNSWISGLPELGYIANIGRSSLLLLDLSSAIDLLHGLQ